MVRRGLFILILFIFIYCDDDYYNDGLFIIWVVGSVSKDKTTNSFLVCSCHNTEVVANICCAGVAGCA